MKLQTLKNIRCKPLAAATAAMLLFAAAAHADEKSSKLTLTGYTDAAAGAELAAGDYAAVIDKLAPHTTDYTVDELAASTNLCVAYVAAGKLDAARDACNEAIAMARLGEFGVSLTDRLSHQDPLSIAYANRAVLTKLSGA
jgi:hypothetical protein